MAKKKNYDSQTNPVRCKKEDKETLNQMFLDVRNKFYADKRKILEVARNEESKEF